MNWLNFMYGAAALALGLVVAYVNTLISKASMKYESIVGVMCSNVIRFALDVAALAVIYFVSTRFDLPMLTMLIAAAMGLTVGGMIMLRVMIKKSQPHETEADGGEKY